MDAKFTGVLSNCQVLVDLERRVLKFEATPYNLRDSEFIAFWDTLEKLADTAKLSGSILEIEITVRRSA